VLAALAAPQGAADLAAFSARQQLARLDMRREVPTPADWQQAQGELQRALALDPDNPALAEALARWYERYTLRLPRSSALRAAYLEQSAAYLRQALVARPGSPHAWTNLALVKLRLGQFDAEFQTALGNARRLGPREPEVQAALARLASHPDAR
jgi:Tfp pilus assembly protein PilF